MMLFDESGALFSAGAVQCPMESLPLPEGRYQLVLLEKTSLLASVPHISRLGELGLTDGTAYVRVPVTIEKGVITQLEPVTVPELDTDILTGAVLEHGSIHVSPGQATINELACLRIDFLAEVRHC